MLRVDYHEGCRGFMATGRALIFGNTPTTVRLADVAVAELVHDGPPDPSLWWDSSGKIAGRSAGETTLGFEAAGRVRSYSVQVTAR